MLSEVPAKNENAQIDNEVIRTFRVSLFRGKTKAATKCAIALNKMTNERMPPQVNMIVRIGIDNRFA